MLCLPVLLAAAPEPQPAPASPPPAGHVKSVPADQDIAILGHTVSAPDGKTIGRVIDVLVDAAGKPEAAVIDVGGFLGVGTRKIAVHWNTLHFLPGSGQDHITLDLTLDQIKAAPEYKSTNRPVPVVVKPHKPATNGPASAAPESAAPVTLTPATNPTIPAATTHTVGQ